MNNIIKYKLYFAVFSMTCFISFFSYAEIIQNKCITKISGILKELPSNLPQKGSTIAVFDWDDTLSKWDNNIGQNFSVFEPREPNKEGTLDTIKVLQNLGVKTMVLTARLGGYPGDYKSKLSPTTKMEAQKHVENMLQMLGGKSSWLKYSPFKTPDFTEMTIEDAFSLTSTNENWEKKRPLYLIALDGIAFAGGNIIKGKAIKQMITGNLFSDAPKNIIFIDNDEKYTNEMKEAFTNAPEHVYIFRYPGPNDKPCSN